MVVMSDNYSITELDDDNVQVDILHSCGHVQSFPRTKRYHELGEQRFPGFVANQYNWLGDNMCPGCFSSAKIINPDIKPIGS